MRTNQELLDRLERLAERIRRESGEALPSLLVCFDDLWNIQDGGGYSGTLDHRPDFVKADDARRGKGLEDA
jgi:hypothetical protein